MYLVCRDKILRYTNWRNQIHYSMAKSVLGYFGVPREKREVVIKELFNYRLLRRENQHIISVPGAKKKCIFF